MHSEVLQYLGMRFVSNLVVLQEPDGAVQADAAALRSAAPALNKFATDGSFLDSVMGERAQPSSNPLQAALQAGQAGQASPASSPEHDADGEAGDRDATNAPRRQESSPSKRPGREQGPAASDAAAGDRPAGVSLL